MQCLKFEDTQVRRFPPPKLSNCQFFRRGNFLQCEGYENIRSLLSSPRSTKSRRRPIIFKANFLDPVQQPLDFSNRKGSIRAKRCLTEGVPSNRHPHDSNLFEKKRKVLPKINVDLLNLPHIKDNPRLYYKKLKPTPLETTKSVRENNIEGLQLSGKIAQILNLDSSFRCKPKLTPTGNRALEIFKFRRTPRFKITNQITKHNYKNSSIDSQSMLNENSVDCYVTFGKKQFHNITCKLPIN